ncbi:uncharacterized protein EV422DRAFT_575173 [Fimicolochytrium jonesii]|uniref:uncharacterized protein n=1 Tax=Fimicolochytrium jonesii TaxID=1396493 RepID=UPI0022FE3A9C|nr:uncharacterized protein EV422DRAFT_575173 [Fimicolochytrium jonesii]KAI8826833.1 hypothetical protein EV422DRAFT_575173 [Fimicolochytrium jonesii]
MADTNDEDSNDAISIHSEGHDMGPPPRPAPNPASTAAPKPASTAAPESASTAAPESASTTAPESASTTASTAAPESASTAASTAAPESASTTAPESASTTTSTAAPQSASTTAPESASTTASTAAPESATVPTSDIPETIPATVPTSDNPSSQAKKKIRLSALARVRQRNHGGQFMRDTPTDINVSSVFHASGIVGDRSNYKYTMMQSILHTMNAMDTSALTMMHALLFSPFEQVLREAHLRVKRCHFQSHQEWQDGIESFISGIHQRMIELFSTKLDLMGGHRVDLLSLVLAEREHASEEEWKEKEREKEIEDRQRM